MKKMEMILNAIKEGVLIVDREEKIEFINDAYAEFIGHSLEEVRGKLLTDIRPGAKLPEAMKKGEVQEQIHRVEKGKEYFVNMYPIYENGEVTGGISTVTFLENARFLAEKIGELNEREAYLDARMKEVNGTRYDFDDIVYGSEVTMHCIEMAKKIAHSDISVLLQGESGCGKELYAQAIHNESERRRYPFIAINCAVLSGNMLESELFGYENGAFTGAQKGGKAGLFEIANKGTLFLDEISEMDYTLQAKLLRALQERKIRRVGGTREIDIDVRIIGACNVNLEKYIQENKFRQDLYYRIAAIPLHLLPLRERKGDVLPLIENHLKKVSIQNKKKIRLTEAARNILLEYNWPGNVRELENILEYATLMSGGNQIDIEDLPPTIMSSRSGELMPTLAERVHQYERQQIMSVLEHFGNSLEGKKQAAKALGISLATLYNKIGKGE
ncbi:sigma-54-dependent Fis family transcriptional regulator [uncultured Eubacterium sp.]|uniref:sigma-54 interaction domain-containing protein n=1 Tax=uncultured Eubacterium sp. TaxID=165185 RepID=UPI002598681E|nr:sigma 54-interacting transcriptional regulator [uncultured Eubacterium sp.]